MSSFLALLPFSLKAPQHSKTPLCSAPIEQHVVDRISHTHSKGLYTFRNSRSVIGFAC